MSRYVGHGRLVVFTHIMVYPTPAWAHHAQDEDSVLGRLNDTTDRASDVLNMQHVMARRHQPRRQLWIIYDRERRDLPSYAS